MELIYNPLILDNIINWRIFDDDEQIINFLNAKGNFNGSVIEDEQHESLLQASSLEDNIEYRNIIPKNIIELEKLFHLQDKLISPTNTKTSISSLRYEVVNLSIQRNPQTIDLGTYCTHVERAAFMRLFKEYKDVFT